MSEVTQLLEAANRGDPQAARELLPLVYAELRKLASQKLAQEKPGQTLQPTALVHEAYLRLAASPGPKASPGAKTGESAAPEFANRRHFFAAAAEAMRRILIDQARRKKTEKHGGGRSRLDVANVEPAAPELDQDIEELDAALAELAAQDPEAAELVRLRWYVGLSMPEAARTMGLSLRSAERQWSYARAWLVRRLKKED